MRYNISGPFLSQIECSNKKLEHGLHHSLKTIVSIHPRKEQKVKCLPNKGDESTDIYLQTPNKLLPNHITVELAVDAKKR